MTEEESEKLVKSINESAQHIGAVTLTFLAVFVYIGIAVASTSHQVLLVGKSIGLPLFEVSIPLEQFYFVAPSLLVFLHLHLLVLDYLLQYKIDRFVGEEHPAEKESDLFFASLPLSILLGGGHPGLIRAFLSLLFLMITVILPVFLLLAIQVVFLPYHSVWITSWHRALILLDIGLIWYFALRTPDFRIRSLVFPGQGQPERSRRRRYIVWSGLVLTLGLIAFSTIVAGGPAAGYEFRMGKPFPWNVFFAPNLSLIDRVLLADASAGKEPPENTKGVQLAERDLRGADFTGAVLIGADFRGADLTGAVFRNADLREARFSPYRNIRWFEIPRRPAPERVVETSTVLRGVDFRGTRLGRANLSQADLRWARLREADLHGVDLSHADLRGADLRGVDLRGANLSAAKLMGADLWRALLTGADLREADLRGAKLVQAEAVATDFSQAKTLGADLRDAQLYLAHGLILEGVDLRGAKLGTVAATCGTGQSLQSPRLSDLRFVSFAPATKEEWEKIQAPLTTTKEKTEDAVYAELVERLDRLRQDEQAGGDSPFCLQVLEQDSGPVPDRFTDAQLLYSSPQISGPMAGWPQPSMDEVEYDKRLARKLVAEACFDFGLAETFIRETSGELVPGHPLAAQRIAREMLEKLPAGRRCVAFWSLSERQRHAIERILKKDPLRTADSSTVSHSGI